MVKDIALITMKYFIVMMHHFFIWCERGDSNPHGFPRRILSPVRLPDSATLAFYFHAVS